MTPQHEINRSAIGRQVYTNRCTQTGIHKQVYSNSANTEQRNWTGEWMTFVSCLA